MDIGFLSRFLETSIKCDITKSSIYIYECIVYLLKSQLHYMAIQFYNNNNNRIIYLEPYCIDILQSKYLDTIFFLCLAHLYFVKHFLENKDYYYYYYKYVSIKELDILIQTVF